MKNKENSQSDNITTFDDSVVIHRIISQKNILPVINDYTYITGTQNSKNSKNSLSNSISCSKIIKNNNSQSLIDNLNTRYHNSELFPFPEKKKYEEKKIFSYKLLKGKVFIKERINKKESNKINDKFNESINESKEENNLFNKLIHSKYHSLDEKRIQIKRSRMPVNEYINKTKELNLMKYTLEIKKEKINRFIEDNISHLHIVNETIKSVNNINDLIVKDIYGKYNEYLKKLEKQYKDDIYENNKLIKTVELKKKEIQEIEFKIKKIKIKKEKLQRWLFLQIQVKEKLLSIPSYYISIFDNSNNIISKKLNLEQSEIDRIKNYKYKIIYENFDEFIHEYKKIEENTLQKIPIYYNIRKEIEYLKKEQQDLLNQKKKINQYEIHLIKDNEELLKNLKILFVNNSFKGTRLENIRNFKISPKTSRNNSTIKNINQNFSINNTARIPKCYLFNSLSKECLGKIQKKGKFPKIYIKIFEIFKNIINCYDKNYNFDHHKNNLTKVDNTNESKMISMLECIEEFVNYLLDKNKYYKKNNILYIQFKNVKSLIEEENKQKKYIRQMEIMKEKRQDIINKIEERINKKYFLPYRKVGVNLIAKITKEKELRLLKRNKSGNLNLKDFLYDIY